MSFENSEINALNGSAVEDVHLAKTNFIEETTTVVSSEEEKAAKDFIENEKNFEETIKNVATEVNGNQDELKSEIESNLISENLVEDVDEDASDSESKETEIESTPKPEPEWQDILGSGVILKKTIKEGVPDTRPARGCKCVLNYVCKLEDDTVIEENHQFEIRLGECDVVQGLDVALGLMNLHEKCIVKIKPRLAFGDKGLTPHIKNDTTIVYDVELVLVEPEDEIEELTVQQRHEIGNKKRARGNWWYQRGENNLAIQCYRRALDYLDEVEGSTLSLSGETKTTQVSDADLQALLEDRLSVCNNMAAAQIKMELYDQALKSLETVLRCQPENIKALFRKAKVYIAKTDLTAAMKLLDKCKELQPNDTLILKEITLVTNMIKKEKSSEREYARRMFGGITPEGSQSPKNIDNSAKPRNKTRILATVCTAVAFGLAGVAAYKLKFA